MTIRPAVPADALAIAEVHVASWQRAYGDLLPAEYLTKLSVPERESLWAESITKGMPHLLVLEVGQQAAGFAALGPCRDLDSKEADYEVWSLYLSPRHWSRGLGRALWLASLEKFVSLGANRVSAWVLAGNERALRFYRAAGFLPERGSCQTFEIGGIQVKEVRCIRDLKGLTIPPSN